MPEERLKRKLSAIFSADVEGYSRLMGDDEASTVRTLESYRKAMADLIDQFRGRVVDSPGDNLLAEFGSVVDAVQCAVEIQEVLKAKNEELSENRRMQFRIGVNLGDVIEEGDRIYGDGVNIAARIEGLAEAGGICISGSAHEQIKTKLAFGYEYIGEHSVKNIAEPLKVYRVPMGPKDVAHKARRVKEAGPKRWRWAALGGVAALIIVIGAVAIWNFYLRRPSVEAADPKRMAYPLPEKPSIAVLPFDNLSGDPEQEYIADGISENIISTLSKVSRMFVIARNSTFTYKGKPVQVQQVAEEQGVRYVLEGSVQKSGDQLRVTAQLIDAINGRHLWSQKYDRKMSNLFDLQDEITKKIVSSLQVEVGLGEEALLYAKSTDNFEAWTNVAKGMKHFYRVKKEENTKARALLEEAIKLDPGYVDAWAYLAETYIIETLLRWSESRSASLKRAHELLQKALTLDDKSPVVHQALGNLYYNRGQIEKAITKFKRALSLDPNFALGYARLGAMMLFMAEFEESITLMKKAMRFSPYYPPHHLAFLGYAYFFTRRYEKAIAAFNQILDRCRNGECPSWRPLSTLAAVYVELERVEEARVFMTEALEQKNPKVILNYYKSVFGTFKDPAHLQRMLDALRKAGLPDKLPLPLPDKPSIAVLPFTNMSDDPKQEYFSDGITENIITGLSKIPNLFVIARNSTFTYKGKPVKVQQVAEELGVQYVLEGSVQRSGDRVRITAQLVDALSGHHLWSDRYDRELKDVFALQDEITMKVTGAMHVKLTAGGGYGRMWGKGTDNLKAFLKVLEGRGIAIPRSGKNAMAARKLYEEAISLDPEYAEAYALLAFTHWINVIMRRSQSPRKSMEKAHELVQKALALDDSLPMAHAMLGNIYVEKRQYDKAIAEAERAVALDPNGAAVHRDLGLILMQSGKPEEAIPVLKKALRLNPFPPGSYFQILGASYRMTGRYEEAIEMLKKAPDHPRNPLELTAIYIYLGREEEARAAAAEVLRRNPKFSLEGYAKRSSLKNKAAHERYIDALRKAGLPD